MYTVNGVLEVTTHEGVWYVPPKQAIWIPPRIEHQARANGEATLQVVIIALPSGLPCPRQPPAWCSSRRCCANCCAA